MKNLLLVSIFGLFFFASFAQDSNKITYAIAPFPEIKGAKNEFGPKLIKAIISECDKYGRFVVVPTDKWAMAGEAWQSQYADRARSLGITYLIIGKIDSVSIYQDSSKDQNAKIITSYNADVVFSINIIESKTGIIFNSDTIHARARSDFKPTFPQKSMTLYPSADSAIVAALYHGGFWVFRMISKTFPEIIRPVRILAKDDKGGALLVLISAGSKSSLLKNIGQYKTGRRKELKIIQYTTETGDNKVLRRIVQIGLAEVDKVDDQNFSECIVTDGRMEVAKKINAGEELFFVPLN